MIQQLQNSCQFHRLPSDDANRHIDKFLEITQSMKQNGVSDDALRLSLFPYSLTHRATAWYDRLPRNSIHTFDDMMRKFLSKYFPPSMNFNLRRLEEMNDKSESYSGYLAAIFKEFLCIGKRGAYFRDGMFKADVGGAYFGDGMFMANLLAKFFQVTGLTATKGLDKEKIR
nr:reverse transcriptase domain-containing protein [Tanacetum cinerariifolium]